MFQYSMLRSPLNTDGLRAARLTATSMAAVALVFCGLIALTAPKAEAASTQRIELGAKNINTLKPNCGRDFTRDCRVEGKVTAFQALSATTPGRNFVVPFNGKLVSWSISLANPTRIDIDDNPAQLPGFNLIFGSPSRAGIAVLRQVEKQKKGGPRYKLVRQTPVEIMNPYFGSKVTFSVEPPLNVYKDNIVALTIPTWVPALWRPKVCNFDEVLGSVNPDACGQAEKKYTWRASRVPRGEDECELKNTQGVPNEQLANTAAQTKNDSVRRYGCYYGGNVLLYSALIVGR